MTAVHKDEVPVQGPDGHRWVLQARIPDDARGGLLWLPALGTAARHYLPFADALAARGIAVLVHEWRGYGASNLRPGRAVDWGYRELLSLDLPATEAVADTLLPGLVRRTGGHSLGGQLALCRVALAPSPGAGLWLVARGAPYWRAFPAPLRHALPLAYRFLPWLARARGFLPGRSVGFGGNEARSLVRDWSRTGLSGRYAAHGLQQDLEARLSRLHLPVRAASFVDDWMAPPGSLRFLLTKVPRAEVQARHFATRDLGARADHFAWMQAPGALAAWLAADPGLPPA